jgi:hypothetical protein
MFKINANDITYVTTHRGVNASAPIRDDEGLEVGSLEDRAEAIVASVRFITPEVRAAFLAEARNQPHEPAAVTGSDEYLVSQYARKLLEDAEEELLKKGS